MLPAWLKNLFGNDEPLSMAEDRLSAWQAWMEPIRAEQPAGDDPAYEDDFLAVKEEVARLSGIDDALIIATAQRLLYEHSKDLRVATYYTFARLRQNGPAGLADGLELIAALLTRYADSVWPQGTTRRRAALEWLNSERFTDQLHLYRDGPRPELERALAALLLIQRQTENWEAEQRPQLATLFKSFEVLLEPESGLAHTSSTSTHGGQATGTDPFTVHAQQDIRSTRDLLDTARRMAIFLRDQSDGYLAAYRLLRVARWDTIAAPPPADEQGHTRLAPPRAELRAQLKRLVLQQQWNELLERVESAFAEGANHLWLDLQHYAWQAQVGAGEPYRAASTICLTDFAQMLERLHGVERLAFNDGTPFAEDSTLEWIAQHAVIRDLDAGESIAPLPVTGDGNDWAETEAQATEMAAQNGLENAFAWVQNLPTPRGERVRCLRQLLLARLAEQHNRQEISLHLLETLETEMRDYRLDRWEPELAFEIHAHLWRLLRQRSQRKDVNKAEFLGRLEQITARLTALDPARTLTLLE